MEREETLEREREKFFERLLTNSPFPRFPFRLFAFSLIRVFVFPLEMVSALCLRGSSRLGDSATEAEPQPQPTVAVASKRLNAFGQRFSLSFLSSSSSLRLFRVPSSEQACQKEPCKTVCLILGISVAAAACWKKEGAKKVDAMRLSS